MVRNNHSLPTKGKKATKHKGRTREGKKEKGHSAEKRQPRQLVTIMKTRTPFLRVNFGQNKRPKISELITKPSPSC